MERSNDGERKCKELNGDLENGISFERLNIDESDDHELEIVTALADFSAKDDTQLSFETGQILSVLCKTNGNWWWARRGNRTGYIPTNHVTTGATGKVTTPDWQDEEYFGSYGMLKLQQEMLSDKPRNAAYQQAIEKNKKFLRGKTVLDVGCGTGFLSMMCVKYGEARKVYSVEASDMAEMARKVVEHNGLSDRITILHSKVEGAVLPEKVDLIISEWMGTLLVFEFMVESVLIARDRWLKDGGMMWPSHARLHLAPSAAARQEDRIDFWNSVSGVDFSCLRIDAMSEYFSKPLINEGLDSKELLAPPAAFYTMDLRTITVEDLEVMKGEFSFTITKSGVFHGFAAWFSVDFAPLGNGENGAECIVLDTGPLSQLTHWKQALFVLDEWSAVETGDAIEGSITLERSYIWRRHLKARLSGKMRAKSSGEVKCFSKTFGVWR